MERISVFILALGVVCDLNYVALAKQDILSDLIFRNMADRMSENIAAAADRYLYYFSENNRLQTNNKSNRVIKDLENEKMSSPFNFERLSDNPNPSLRDGEYLQYSGSWGHKFMTGGAGEGKQRLKPDGSVKNRQQVKTDSILPTYCNPPNPCPVGYTEEDGCLEEFENTAAFSRNFQTSQSCMCDSEHMIECSEDDFNDMNIDQMLEKLSAQDQLKTLAVAKKFHVKKGLNFLTDKENLPEAALKGTGWTICRIHPH